MADPPLVYRKKQLVECRGCSHDLTGVMEAVARRWVDRAIGDRDLHFGRVVLDPCVGGDTDPEITVVVASRSRVQGR